MSKLKDGFLPDTDGDDTVIVDTHELEKKLREERGGTSDADVVIYPDGLDLSEFRYDDETTVPEPSPMPPPEPKQPEPPRRRTVYEEERQSRKKQNKRVGLIIAIALAVVLALVIGSIAVRSAVRSRTYDKNFSAAQNYYYDGEYDKALDELRQAMAADKTDECLLLMSACYEAKGDYVNAIAILESSKTGNKTVARRIESLKLAKEEYEQGKTVLIGGEPYDVESTMVDLSGKHLRSNRLTELIKLTGLTSLKLNNNLITGLDFLVGLDRLVSLDLSDNSITDIAPLAALRELRTLHLDNNTAIEDFTPLYSLDLSTLSIVGIEISESQLKELKEALPGCVIFSEDASEDVVEIELGGRKFMSDVTSLDLSDCGLTDIYALSACKNITTLNLSGNMIQDISPLMDMPELRTLDLSGNLIKDIRPLMGLSKLELLDLEDNDISSVAALVGLTELKELYLKNNELSGFTALEKLGKLKVIGLQNTGLNDDGLTKLYGLTKLTAAALDDNPAITRKGIEELKAKLPECKLTYTEPAEQLEIGGVSVDVSSESVTLAGLGITDITPLSKLVRVTYLDLSCNSISDFTPLYGLSTLTELYIAGNSFTPEQLKQLEEALPNCVVNAMD